MIAHREVSSTDRARKYDVTNPRKLLFCIVENNVARRVSGAMDDGELKITDGDRISIN
jgi:hypothetical protein